MFVAGVAFVLAVHPPPPPLAPTHRTACGGRTCLPGEGNPTVTHGDNPYTFDLPKDAIRKAPPHEPDPLSPQYAPLLTAAKAVAHSHHKLVIMCAADFDYREMAENWHRAIKRAGLSNGLVYALDREVHAYLGAKGVPSFDGSANLNAWNTTRLQRHIQRADAERHLAAAAIAAGGLDVLLTDTTHVLLGDVMPPLIALAKEGGVDAAVPRGTCGGKAPVGCGLSWNVVFLRGAGTSEQRQRAVAWQLAGVRKGMVDFYLRWWNGAHCIHNGFGKHYDGCGPKLDGGLTATDMVNSTEAASLTLTGCERLKLGLLPGSFFHAGPLYGPSGQPRPTSLIARSPKPSQRDRLRLDRYDSQDFEELKAAMVSDRLWIN